VIDLWDAKTQQKKVDELRQVQWALFQAPPWSDPINPYLNERFALSTHYRVIHPSYWNGPFAIEIDRNWELAGHIGNYLLYRRIR
jgi:hypothetical protein